VQATPAFNATWGGVTLPALLGATTYTVNVPVSNSGAAAWNATGANRVDLGYHWTDASGQVVVWDGARTPLPADVPAGGSATVAATVTTPAAIGSYTLTLDLVREGVAWFGSLGGLPLQIRTTVSPAVYAAGYATSATTQAFIGESRTVTVMVTNRGNVPWAAAGPNPVHLSYHLIAPNGGVVLWDGARTALGADLAPGASATINVAYTAPTTIGTYTLAIDTVREGVAWFSQIGSPSATAALIVTSGFNGGYGQTTTPGLATVGASLLLTVRISNYGARAWPAAGPNPVHLGYHILTPAGVAVTWDGQRGLLPSDVAVGQNFAGHPAQIAKTADQPLECARSSLVGGESNRWRPAESQDGHHRAQLDHLVTEWEQAQLGPVDLGLNARPGLEANLGVLDLGRSEQPEVTLEGRVAALVAVLVTEFGVEIGATDAGAHAEAALDVNQLSLFELSRLGSDIAPRGGARQLLVDRRAA